ncbi:hypothetical protein K3495_g14175 [Podosphaera aphanis]|nr:hypothetical protein K3495_g14175 [Podosphaera aphanis]
MVRSQRVVALHTRNSGTFRTQREATRSERVRPNNRATPPIEEIGSSETPIVFPTDPVDVSLIQSARRNGIPPPRKRTRLMKPIPPPGIRLVIATRNVQLDLVDIAKREDRVVSTVMVEVGLVRTWEIPNLLNTIARPEYQMQLHRLVILVN